MKRIWNIVQTALTWGLIIFTLCMVVFTTITVRTVDARERSIFGYKLMIVQSDSMSATDFKAGDLIIVKEVDPATLQAGDIISFVSRNSHNPGETVTHKIRSLTEDENGWAGFVTYGTTTDTDDEAIVRHSDVLGQYITRIENMGMFFAFMRTPKGYITIILIPLLLIILVTLFNCIRMFTGAQKQVEEDHQNAVEKERREKEQMRRELEELRILVRKTAARQQYLQKMLMDSGLLQPPPQKAADSREKPVEAAPVKQPEAAPARKEPAAPAKTQDAPKKAAPPVKKPDGPKPSPKQEPPKPEGQKTGRLAAGSDRKKTGVSPEPKPVSRTGGSVGGRELDLENILEEFRPQGK